MSVHRELGSIVNEDWRGGWGGLQHSGEHACSLEEVMLLYASLRTPGSECWFCPV